MKKGPQTIEKAKQGAYVARTVSSLQKFRLKTGAVRGVLDTGDGELRTGDYQELLADIIKGFDSAYLSQFLLTVGIVSNHGNWFTAETQNKEMKVLAQAYDRLLFLTDNGLCQFIERLLLAPVPELEKAREAFLASYNGDKKKVGSQRTSNCFTKVTMHVDADSALKHYFETHEHEIESWFNVIEPAGASITKLRDDLRELAAKPWKEIRGI